MSDKNEIIRSAAAQVAENYRKSDITPVLPLVLVSPIPVLPDLWKQLYPVQSGLQNPEPYQAPWSARPDS